MPRSRHSGLRRRDPGAPGYPRRLALAARRLPAGVDVSRLQTEKGLALIRRRLRPTTGAGA
jgi:hypothetical protein